MGRPKVLYGAWNQYICSQIFNCCSRSFGKLENNIYKSSDFHWLSRHFIEIDFEQPVPISIETCKRIINRLHSVTLSNLNLLLNQITKLLDHCLVRRIVCWQYYWSNKQNPQDSNIGTFSDTTWSWTKDSTIKYNVTRRTESFNFRVLFSIYILQNC